MSDQRLAALAHAAGLAVDWTDADGRPQRVTPEVLRRVLDGLGLAADSEAQIKESLAKLNEDDPRKHLPPMLTVDAEQPLDLSRHFPPDTPFQLGLADGGEISGQLDGTGRLPGFSCVGYQQLRIGDQQLTLAVAPPHCHRLTEVTKHEWPRAWGLAVQLYSLRRDGDGGLGDTQALETLAHAAAARGADALAISPLHAMFSADTQRFSPYSPSSRLFFNILHSSPGSILGERAVRQAVLADGLGEEMQRLEQLSLIDWPAAAQAKLRLLRTLFEGFRHGGNPWSQDLASFRQAGGEALENHCRFEALHAYHVEHHGFWHWRHWPAELRDPRQPAVVRFAKEHAAEVDFHAFGQWLIARGLERTQAAARTAGMGIGLVSDLAVGADGGGSQAWSRQAELLSTLTVGAPPDILNRSGQGWGISAFSPNGLIHHGFHAFIEMLRANLAHAGGMRIDHVMGLKRLWVIPQDADPKEGAYLHYPFDDLLRLLVLESWRHRAVILGEDLGTVPEGLRERLAERGILGMRVLQFEQDATAHFRAPRDWPAEAMATTATHDLPTMTGWWLGRDIDWRARIGQIDEQTQQRDHQVRARERGALSSALATDGNVSLDHVLGSAEMLDACIAFIGHTPAQLVLLPMEDVLGLEEQANLPGTIDSHPNWRRRWPGQSTALLDSEVAERRLTILREARGRM